jgi:hypothetical protein
MEHIEIPKDIKLRGGNNVMLTQALFVEFGNKHAPFTMKHESYKDYVSFYEVYMNSVDEYDAAIKLVKNIVHWKKLCSLDWFMEGFPEINISGLRAWREDMKARDASSAKRTLMEQNNEGNVNAAKALRDIANGKDKKAEPKVQDSKGRGRPSKSTEDELTGGESSVVALYNKVKLGNAN